MLKKHECPGRWLYLLQLQIEGVEKFPKKYIRFPPILMMLSQNNPELITSVV